MSKPRPGQPRAISADRYAEAVAYAAELRAQGEHAKADELMGLAVEARRLDRDARLVATEYGRYPEITEDAKGEGK